MEDEIIDDSEKRIRTNFKIWMLTNSPSNEAIVKKWYDNFTSCSLNNKISYLKLISKLVEMKRKNFKVTQSAFFEILDMAFTHVSKLANDNSKLFNMITQVALEWNNKNLFTSTQIRKLQDLIISRNSNNSIEEYNPALPLRIAFQRHRLESRQSVAAIINEESITVKRQNYGILKSQFTLLKDILIDLYANFTQEKYFAVKTFFQATLENLEEIVQENRSSLEVNRNFLIMMHKVIKDSERET